MSTALTATVGEGQDFETGRQLAAYLGLVPRQASSGSKERLLGISKRGDGYLRGLFVHGARALIHHIRRHLKANQPGGNSWVVQLLYRCNVNEAAVALSNKNGTNRRTHQANCIYPCSAGVAMMSSPSIDIPRTQHEFKLIQKRNQPPALV